MVFVGKYMTAALSLFIGCVGGRGGDLRFWAVMV